MYARIHAISVNHVKWYDFDKNITLRRGPVCLIYTAFCENKCACLNKCTPTFKFTWPYLENRSDSDFQQLLLRYSWGGIGGNLTRLRPQFMLPRPVRLFSEIQYLHKMNIFVTIIPPVSLNELNSDLLASLLLMLPYLAMSLIFQLSSRPML